MSSVSLTVSYTEDGSFFFARGCDPTRRRSKRAPKAGGSKGRRARAPPRNFERCSLSLTAKIEAKTELFSVSMLTVSLYAMNSG